MANIAIAGATGLVGEQLLKVLEQRNFPVEKLRLLASDRSEGRKHIFKDREFEVENLDSASFEGIDVAFFALSEDLTRKYEPKAIKHSLVIDKSSTFRLKVDVPLVVPEVNPDAIAAHRNLIATPNCTTIPLVVALAPLHRAFGLRRVVLSSYQSASGAGRAGLDEYLYETEFVALRRPVERPDDSPFQVRLAGNVIPQIGDFSADGYGTEEHKTMSEMRKILGLPDLAISATCVRVPVATGHALSVLTEFDQTPDLKRARAALHDAPGITLMEEGYPTPAEAEGCDEVLAARLRKDASSDNGLLLWIVADNLRKGAATNAVQIAEIALKIKK